MTSNSKKTSAIRNRKSTPNKKNLKTREKTIAENIKRIAEYEKENKA